MKIVREILGSGDSSLSFSDPNLRKSFRLIARNLQVDQGTIRNRVRKLNSSGVFRRWTVGVNPRIFGLRMVQLWIDVSPNIEKDDCIKKIISLVRGVATIEDYLGVLLSVRLCYEIEKDLERNLRLIAELTGSSDIIKGTKRYLPCNLKITTIDWKIVKSLQGNPWREYHQIAEHTGISIARVKRRIEKLVESGALHILADVNPKLQRGSVMMGLAVFFEDKKYRNSLNDRILELLGDELAFGDVDDEMHSYFGVVLSNVLKMEDISSVVGKMIGVKAVRAAVLQDSISLESVYDEYAERFFGSSV